MTATGPYAVHFDEKAVEAARGLAHSGNRAQWLREVIVGERTYTTVAGWAIWSTWTQAMHRHRVPFACAARQGSDEMTILAIGDVPDAPEIQAPDYDGVAAETARTWRIRWCAEVDGIDRDERIERVRCVPDAISILDLCAPPNVAAMYRVCGRQAADVMRQIREAIDAARIGTVEPGSAFEAVMAAQTRALSNEVLLRIVRANLRADLDLHDAVRRMGEATVDLVAVDGDITRA